ncbi:MAG: HEAT repeat domain-containing protein [Promethearchaeota archaeon]
MIPDKDEDIDPAIRKIMQIPDDQELPPDALCDVMLRALESHQLLIRASAVNQLVTLGKNNPQMAIPKILAALNPSIDYWTVRFGAVEALGEIANKSTIGPLIKYLESDEDPDFRAMVAKQLGEMGDVANEAGQSLIKALYDNESSEIRENAAHAIGQIKIHSAVEPLIKALEKEPEEYARREMSWSLGELQDARALNALIKSLKDKDKGTRANAAEALGKINRGESVLPLLQLTKDKDVDVQGKAIWALQQLPSEVIVSEIEKAAQGDSLIAIQYYDEYLFNVDNDMVSKICREIKDPIIVEYQAELVKIKTELERCKVFVSENFAKLANLSVEELKTLIQRDIPAIESRIGSISLYKYRKYKWIENDLYFDLGQVNNLYKESGVMISELRDNTQSLLKKKDKKASIMDVPNTD